jgi:hypothetical protein
MHTILLSFLSIAAAKLSECFVVFFYREAKYFIVFSIEEENLKNESLNILFILYRSTLNRRFSRWIKI